MKEKANISSDKFKYNSQSTIIKRNDDSSNDEFLNGFSKSISNFYETCYKNEPSRLGIIYNITKNENKNSNMRDLTRSATNLMSKIDVDKYFKTKKQVEIKNVFNDLNDNRQQVKCHNNKIPTQPLFKHYARHVATSEVIIENQCEGKNLKTAPQTQYQQNRDDFNKVIRLLLRVKPRKLSLREIRALNVSEKFEKEVSKLTFYPQFLAFSPIFK